MSKHNSALKPSAKSSVSSLNPNEIITRKIFPVVRTSQIDNFKSSDALLHFGKSQEPSEIFEPNSASPSCQSPSKSHFMVGFPNEKQTVSRISLLWNTIINILRMKKLFMNKTGLKKLKYTESQLIPINNLYFPNTDVKENQFHMRVLMEKNFFRRSYYKILFYLTVSRFYNILKSSIKGCQNYFYMKVPVIQPHQKFKIGWDILILIIIFFYFFVIPLQICFEIFYELEFLKFSRSHSIPEILAILFAKIPATILFIDSILKLITGYFENGKIILDKDKIIRNYTKNELKYDLLSYFPIFLQSITIITSNFSSSNTLFSYALKGIECLIFCKLKSLNSLLRNFENAMSIYGIPDHYLSLLRTTVRIVFGSHIGACIWHAVAIFRISSEYTWLHSSNFIEEDWITRYYHSIYWAIAYKARTIPQGDIEIFVGSAVTLALSINYGFNLGFIGKIVDAMTRDEKSFKDTLIIINGYMKKKNIDFELQGRVRTFLEYNFQNQKNSDKEMEIINKLTTTLKNEVLQQSQGILLNKNPFFSKNFSLGFIQNLSIKMDQKKFSPEEIIFKPNDLDFENDPIYIVNDGEIGELNKTSNSSENIFINTYKKGQIVDIKRFLTGERSKTLLISKNYSTVFRIKKQDFFQELKKNRKDFETYCQIRDNLMTYHSPKNVFNICQCCRSQTHFIYECPDLHYLADKDFIIKKHNYSENQKRWEYKDRKKKKSLNALKCHDLIVEGTNKLTEISLSITDSSFDSEEEEDQSIEEKYVPQKISSYELKTEEDLNINLNITEQGRSNNFSSMTFPLENNLLLNSTAMGPQKGNGENSIIAPTSPNRMLMSKKSMKSSILINNDGSPYRKSRQYIPGIVENKIDENKPRNPVSFANFDQIAKFSTTIEPNIIRKSKIITAFDVPLPRQSSTMIDDNHPQKKNSIIINGNDPKLSRKSKVEQEAEELKKLFFYEFDTVFNTVEYFTHNNIENVLKEFRGRRRYNNERKRTFLKNKKISMIKNKESKNLIV